MVTIPLGFLVGIGGFDYWIALRVRRADRARGPLGPRRQALADYFRINTDHKVIGVQYVVTTIVFFMVGGLLAMIFRAELAHPGTQYFDTQTFNGLVSVPRGADDLPLHHPGVRRSRELRRSR